MEILTSSILGMFYSKLPNSPSGEINNHSGWAEGPNARARKLARVPDSSSGAHGTPWAPELESGARANFRARAWGPSAQPEGSIIKPEGLLSNFEYMGIERLQWCANYYHRMPQQFPHHIPCGVP